MTDNVIPISSRPGRRMIAVEQLSLDPEKWLIACACGYQQRVATKSEAQAVKRRHQAAHNRAEQAHPAGKARLPRGGAPA